MIIDEGRWVPVFGKPVGEWSRWFAWRPIQTWDKRWCWLSHVDRRLVVKHHYLAGGPDFWWTYRTITTRGQRGIG